MMATQQANRAEMIQASLVAHDNAMAKFNQECVKFYRMAQLGSFEAAEVYRTNALAWMEAGMDAFTRSCRLQLDPDADG